MTKNIRKKINNIKVITWTGKNIEEVLTFLLNGKGNFRHLGGDFVLHSNNILYISTPKKNIVIDKKDKIIKNGKLILLESTNKNGSQKSLKLSKY